jgi:hypothetical protein
VEEKARMFLLCQDDVAREDGTSTIHSPFMITLPNRLSGFVAFPTQELAEYFKKMLKLEDEYRSVDVCIMEKRKLKESRYLYVFSARSDIHRLFSEKKKNRCRMQNVMEIAKIRPDA